MIRLFRLRRPVEEEIDEELAFHLEESQRALREAGLDPAAAREEALRRFGDSPEARQQAIREARRARGGERLAGFAEGVRVDLAYALRRLRRAPGFAAVALLTLALGIGASTAIFSGVRGVLLRPLPFRDPQRLVRIWTANPSHDVARGGVSLPDLIDWSQRAAELESVAGWAILPDRVLERGGEPELLKTALVSGDFFSTLGLGAMLGRTLDPSEQSEGSNRVLVLSHAAWRGLFGGRPEAVGSTVRLDGDPFTVVGVLPAEVRFPEPDVQAFMPLTVVPETGIPRLRGVRYLSGVGRLRPGLTLQQANRGLDAVQKDLAGRYPEMSATWDRVSMSPLHDALVADARGGLLALLGAVGVLLLIACVNVSNLLLAGNLARQRELAVRSALGAGRGRLVRQLLTEAALLGLMGGVLGIAVAQWGVDSLVAMSGSYLPRNADVRLDLPVLAFALGLSLAAGLAAGALPALRVRAMDLMASLRETQPGRGAARMREVLISMEVALAVALLAGAGLMIHSFLRLARVNPGFQADRALVARFSLPTGHDFPWQRAYADALERVRLVPGVLSAGASKAVPLRGQGERWGFTVDGEPAVSAAEMPVAEAFPVSPGYFGAMGIPLLAGRDFTTGDGESRPKVAVVDEALARKYFGGRDAVGRMLRIGELHVQVIGVAGAVRFAQLQADPVPTLYLAQAQLGRAAVALVVRTAGDPASLISPVREAIRAAIPGMPLSEVIPMRTIVSEAMAAPRFLAFLLGLFAAAALVLAAVGLYGVVTTVFAQRTHEIGVRMALGADGRDVMALMLRLALRPVAVGLLAGVGVAAAAGKLVEGLLFQTSAGDPLTYAVVLALLAGTALLAAWIPSRRATRVPPAIALRAE